MVHIHLGTAWLLSSGQLWREKAQSTFLGETLLFACNVYGNGFTQHISNIFSKYKEKYLLIKASNTRLFSVSEVFNNFSTITLRWKLIKLISNFQSHFEESAYSVASFGLLLFFHCAVQFGLVWYNTPWSSTPRSTRDHANWSRHREALSLWAKIQRN